MSRTRTALSIPILASLIILTTCLVATAFPYFPWDEESRELFLQDLKEGELYAEVLDSKLLNYPVYQVSIEVLTDQLFSGREVVMYSNRTDIELHELCLHLLPNCLGGSIVLSAVHVDGEDNEIVFDIDDRSIGWIYLDSPLLPGESTLLDFDFSVEVPIDTSESVIDTRFSNTSGVLSAAYPFPIVADYRQDGWDIRRPTIEGEFVYREHALFAVGISAPIDFEVVSSGFEIGEPRVSTSGLAKSRFFVSGPTNDFFWGGSYRFSVFEDTVGTTLIKCYAPSDMEGLARMAIGYTKQALIVFTEILSPYPYNELDIVLMDLDLGLGGAEFTGLFILNWNAVSWTYGLYGISDPQSDIMIETIVVHEVAHQWFAISLSSDPVLESWIDEGFAQLATWMYFVELYDSFGFFGFQSTLRYVYGDFALVQPLPLDKEGFGDAIYDLAPQVLFETLRRGSGGPKGDFYMDSINTTMFMVDLVAEFEMSPLTTRQLLDFVRLHQLDAGAEYLVEWLSLE